MIPPPPGSILTDPLMPNPTLFRTLDQQDEICILATVWGKIHCRGAGILCNAASVCSLGKFKVSLPRRGTARTQVGRPQITFKGNEVDRKSTRLNYSH